MNYQGCLLLVSHDRYFMDKCADTLFIMEEDGSISGFVGKCSEYIEVRQEMLQEEKRNKSAEKENSKPSAPDSGKKQKLSFKEQKEFEELDREIPLLEKEEKELEPLMSSPDFSVVSKASQRYNEIVKLLEQKYPRWEELAERVL